MGLLDMITKKKKQDDPNAGFIKSGQVKLIDDVLAAEEEAEKRRNKKQTGGE